MTCELFPAFGNCNNAVVNVSVYVFIWTQASCIAGGFFTSWATREVQEYWSG